MRFQFIALLGAASLAIAACEKEPTGQTVAVVNGEEITSAELNAALQQVNVPEGVDRQAATSRVLEQMIDRRLLVQQAREEGIDKTPEFINGQRRATEDLLIGLLTQRKTRTSEVPSKEEIESFKAQHPERFAKREMWGLNQLVYKTPEDEAVIEQIKQTKTLDQLANVLQSNGIDFERKQAQLDTATLPREIYEQINGLPAGEPFLVPNQGMTVASVIAARRPNPLQGADADRVAAQQFRQTESSSKMGDQVKSLRAKAKIDYKEGFAPDAKEKAPAGS